MSVRWDTYDVFDDIEKKYLPPSGEGDNMATQIVTAVTKLVYKWYNDGDVFDNTGYMSGWANDLSSYANWLYKYVPKTRIILDSIYDTSTDSEYEDLLYELSQEVLKDDVLSKFEAKEKQGSIYDCDGPYEFREQEEEDWDDEEYDEDIESAVDINAAEEPKNEALDEAMRNLKDDFDFIIQGLEKLERSSAEDSRIALEIAEGFSTNIQETIAAISERF